MLKRNNKSMFFILLAPLYLLLFICLIGMSMGSVEWLYMAFIAIIIILAAWGLSRENSIFINMIGLLFMTGLGTYFIYPTLVRTDRIGPWTISIYVGSALVLWGFIAFIYDIAKLKNDSKQK
jgi:hypothetical protein